MSSKAAFSDLKILLVEDQDDAREMLRDMMNQLGITQIFEAADGTEALKFLESAYDFIDLVICDWNMPEKSGVEVLKELREVNKSLPFLMVTGRKDMDSVVEAKSSGVTAYISKPFSDKQLEAKLRVILHKMSS